MLWLNICNLPIRGSKIEQKQLMKENKGGLDLNKLNLTKLFLLQMLGNKWTVVLRVFIIIAHHNSPEWSVFTEVSMTPWINVNSHCQDSLTVFVSSGFLSLHPTVSLLPSAHSLCLSLPPVHSPAPPLQQSCQQRVCVCLYVGVSACVCVCVCVC